jgi:tetratricopeptide (TPR) repeat protein
MRFLQTCVLLVVVAALPAAPTAEFQAAMELYNSHRYPEARPLFEKIAAAEPKNAAAAFYLGRCIEPRADADALPEALKWYEKAVALEPENPIYLARFGGASLQLAARTNSLGAATRGRDAMEKAIKLNPDDLDAREGLMQFYERAPLWLGSSGKAAAQLEEIRKRDPDRATVLSVLAKTKAGEYTAAFQLCDQVLAKKPDNYTALYQYGRTAAISGENLERGLKCLQKCATLTPPGPASPSLSNVWNRLGDVQQKLHHPAEARAAYETALKLDPTNKQAADSLSKLN